MKRYIVQRLAQFDQDGLRWEDVLKCEASDPGSALQRAFDDPDHHISATTYRVAEEALTVNVSINLESSGGGVTHGCQSGDRRALPDRLT